MAKQTQSFNAEIKQLLDIVIHSLYSQKEIFLRELISNASDAIDKLRFHSLTNAELLPAGWQGAIRVEANKETKSLTISDNGIGMSPDEVVEFIGTIARSGAKAFSQLTAEMKERPELIGQFGVGFYSAFMVADLVQLHTQKAGTSVGTLWESSGDGSYTIDSGLRPEGTGTTITLRLKKQAEEEDGQDFTDEWLLKSLIKKYSDFISYPVLLKTEKGDETVNSQKALWLKTAAEVTAEEYNEFYQHLSHDYHAPLKTIHYKAEGTIEFHALLYIPTKKPWNYLSRDTEYGLSLYVKRIFILNDCKELLPSYLRFVKGMVDSSDLSLNVSRELLQQDRQVTLIKKNVVAKILGGLKDLFLNDRAQYELFWSEFGSTLKEGIPYDPVNKEKLQDILLFRSTTAPGLASLDEYIGRMKPGQKAIYFLSGDTLDQVSNSPYLEKLREKNFEVLLLIDPVDEWVVQAMTTYKDHHLTSAATSQLDLESADEKKSKDDAHKKVSAEFGPLLDFLKKRLEENVSDVVLSERLVSTPTCLTNADNQMSNQMEKILMQMGQGPAAASKRILEINAAHPVFKKMMSVPESIRAEWADILYGQAVLNEGSQLKNPVQFSKQIAELMANGSFG